MRDETRELVRRLNAATRPSDLDREPVLAGLETLARTQPSELVQAMGDPALASEDLWEVLLSHCRDRQAVLTEIILTNCSEYSGLAIDELIADPVEESQLDVILEKLPTADIDRRLRIVSYIVAACERLSNSVFGFGSDERLYKCLIDLFDDESPDIRKLALLAAAKANECYSCSDSFWPMRGVSTAALYAALMNKCADADPTIRAAAILAVGNFLDERIWMPLVQRCADPDLLVADQSMKSLRHAVKVFSECRCALEGSVVLVQEILKLVRQAPQGASNVGCRILWAPLPLLRTDESHDEIVGMVRGAMADIPGDATDDMARIVVELQKGEG